MKKLTQGRLLVFSIVLSLFLSVAHAQEVVTNPLPFQVPLWNEKFSVFYNKASEYVGVNTSDCAKFVNRMFLVRFGKIMYGNAWEIQAKPANQEFLTMAWKVPDDQIYRNSSLWVPNDEMRVQHFRDLYAKIRESEMPMGVIGFVYRFSTHRADLVGKKNVLPQTHVAFLAGAKTFLVENTTATPQTVEQLLVAQYGVILEDEKPFVNEILPLQRLLQPGEKVFYNDFLVEEHFKKVMTGSLLSVFLRKHENNHETPLLRPMSFSRISDSLISEIRDQEAKLQMFGDADYIEGKDLAQNPSLISTEWKIILKNIFHIDAPEKLIILPVPKNQQAFGPFHEES